MKVRSVSYQRGVTLRTGDYESVRVEIGAEGDVEPGESFEAAFLALKEEVDALLGTEVKTVRHRVRRAANAASDSSE